MDNINLSSFLIFNNFYGKEANGLKIKIKKYNQISLLLDKSV